MMRFFAKAVCAASILIILPHAAHAASFFTAFGAGSLALGGLLALALVLAVVLFRRSCAHISRLEHAGIMLDATGDIMALVNRDYEYVAVNRAYCKATRCDQSELVGRTVSEVWGRELFAVQIKERLDRCLAGEVVSERSELVLEEDTPSRCVVRIYPDFDGRGNVRHALVVIRVIGVADEAEQVLGESERRYFGLVENSNTIVLRLSPNGQILFINTYGLRFFGYTEQELVGRQLVGSILPETDAKGFPLWEMARGIVMIPEAYAQNENENICKDGRRVRVAWSNKGLYGPDGELKEILSIGIDVTENYRIREENRESRERFELLVNTIDQGFWLRDGDHLTYMSSGFERIFGVPTNKILRNPRTLLSVIHTEDRERVKNAILGKEYCEQGKLHLEFRFIGPDGLQHWGLARSYPIHRDGRLTRIVGLVEDVTKYRKMVDDLERAKEGIEFADKAKSMFLANMSHEFRTPLNGIIGMLQLMGMAELPEKLAGYVQTASTSAGTLMAVLNSVLEYIDIESGRAQYSEQMFSVNNLVEGLRQTMQGEVAEKGVALEIELDASCPDVVVGDSGHLRQAMLKILSNAVKYTEEGEIRISAWCVEHEPEGDEHGMELMLSVSDTGHGIPKSALGGVFDIFTQGEMGYVRRDRGAGLGLGIVKRLVLLMKGGVALESEEGMGTILTLRVPVGLRPVNKDQ